MGLLSVPNISVLVTLAIFLLVGAVILVRTRQVVGVQLATEEHEAELSGQLVQAAKLASVGELAAGIAHEINNPLAIIAEEVGVMKDSLDPELAEEDEEPLDFREHLDAIYEAVFRCRDITRKLLTFVRKTEVKVEPQDVHGILDDVLDAMMGNELAISNVVVEKRFDPQVTEILTDRNQLIQVFVNLVKNSIDAMPGGGRLTVTTRLRDGRAAVAVRDTGLGMSPEHIERVFMPFFTTKDPGKGTGLGLSVSYTIIHNFGGDFYVESTLGKGSTFTVELPLAAGTTSPGA
jgi:two-component system NtrC family sensor kinase